LLDIWSYSGGASHSYCLHDGSPNPYYHYGLRTQVAQMGYSDTEEIIDMKCSIDGCPGEYEAGKVMHTVRHQGQIIVIDHVPADVCSVCGDVLLKPDTVRRIESLLQEKHQPASTVPLYEFA